ncbi:TPA: pneumococcal-type histidine triad protein [Streptococcus equi subsp. zooepidemicus]|nr:pneumococcal-type histidine triad protein [Streptococcus equi subsp. zooepidemicus]HEL1083772.1 pneumococcal-type histidine triad protein [Streptococcus equi subsp. zooepidemicus]
MKSKKLMLMASLFMACHLILTACQSTKQQTNQPKTKQTAKKATKKKQSKKVKKTRKDRKGVAGIDFPTDDGFILTKDSKILSRTENGIVVEHDGHSHFIFYADLKGSKFEYLIPKDADLNKPEQTKAASGHHHTSANDPHHHYVFNPADIVAEDALGYIVRHGDHYHYILKSSLGGQVAYPVPNHVPLSNPSSPAGKFAGVDYPTSDGFLFDGTGIVGRTSYGLIVDHNGHNHLVTYESLRHSKWKHLIETPKEEAPAKPESDLEKTIALKKAHLAKSLNIPEDSIRVEHTEEGVILDYPHGDHRHATYIDDIDLSKPFDPHAVDPHAKDRIGMATLRKLGFDEEVISSIIHASAPTEFPSRERDLEKMKAWLATVEYLNIGEIKDPLKRAGLNLMPNIQILGIGFTPITDITPVYQFKNLKQLWMTQTGIKNYDFLKNLPTLEGIDISQNGVSDLSFLKAFPHYKVISAAGNDITDISILKELPNLESVNLDFNKITDLSALANAQKLVAVSLEHNQIKDLSALSNKGQLTKLFVSNNPDLDLSTLKSSALKEITAKEVNLQSLSFVKDLPALEQLVVDQNKLNSLTGLEQNKSLIQLSANQNMINSLALSGKQSSLQSLNLEENQLTNFEGVNNYLALEAINVNRNKINTLALKEPNQTLKYIQADGNHFPAEELAAESGQFPQGIIKNFKAAEGGSLNNAAPEAAEAAQDEHKQADTDHEEADSHDHETADEHHDHDHDDHHHG